MTQQIDLYIHGISELVACVSEPANPLGRVKDGAIAISAGKIAAVGPRSKLEQGTDLAGAIRLDLGGQIAAPGFVDCHTHLVFGRSRVREYALKMTRTAAEIEATGLKVGIPASIFMTRAASEDELYAGALDRLQRMLRYGTTTLESKSGYGIRWADELKCLQVNRRLAESQAVEVVSTFVGAHDFPPEIDRNDPAARRSYIREVVEEMIPRVAEGDLAEFCDIYCDTGYYTAEESREILEAGMAHGLKPRIHTDAYANVGGSTLAAGLPAVSADHLNYTTGEEMQLLAAAGVVGVVLPALDFAVAHPDPFDARAMLDAGMTLALGTNLNPAAWNESMQLVMQLA